MAKVPKTSGQGVSRLASKAGNKLGVGRGLGKGLGKGLGIAGSGLTDKSMAGTKKAKKGPSKSKKDGMFPVSKPIVDLADPEE